VTPTSGVNCADITRVKPEQPAYEIFSIKRRFQQSKSRTPLQGNLPTLLKYQVYTLDIFWLSLSRILVFILLFSFLSEFFAVCPNLLRVLPESGGGRAAAPSPSGSYAHAQ